MGCVDHLSDISPRQHNGKPPSRMASKWPQLATF